VDFDKYKKLVTYYWQTDNRELNIQNRIIIPFLESILNYDIVDTSTIYSNQKKTKRADFAAYHSPDIVIAENWFWNIEDKQIVKDKTRYKAIIEVKTLANKERKQSQNQVREYLTKVPIVILTDALMWEIYFADSGKTIKILDFGTLLLLFSLAREGTVQPGSKYFSVFYYFYWFYMPLAALFSLVSTLFSLVLFNFILQEPRDLARWVIWLLLVLLSLVNDWKIYACLKFMNKLRLEKKKSSLP